jgi:hypothetical protein
VGKICEVYCGSISEPISVDIDIIVGRTVSRVAH